MGALVWAPARAVHAQVPAPPPRVLPAAQAELAGRLAAILDAPALRHASVGMLVRSLAPSGRVFFERNADLVFVPASNQKISTAATALARLGTDFRFETRALCAAGTLESDGTLRGDVVLVGTGDPSLTSPRLGDLARQIAAKGVKRVTGRVVADDSRFDAKRLGEGWQWDDEPFDYQPQVSALNLDENVVRVSVAPGARAGDAARVTLDPPTLYARVVGAVRTGTAGGKTRVSFDRARGKNDLLVNGEIAAGAKPETGTLTIEEPSLFAAARLAELLRDAGVVVAGDLPGRSLAVPAATTTLLGATSSEPLSTLVRDMMKRSDNLYAETLLKAAGACVEAGKPGSTAAGARTVAALLAQAGGDAAALRVADGSGLSRLNLVSPRNLVALLTYLADENKAGPGVAQAFRNALPIGGVDGTLRNRFENTPAQNVVRAKTGSLSGVSALSGYLTTRAGEPLVFSILMNNVLAGTATARAAQDALVLALMDAPLPPPGSGPNVLGRR